MVVKLIKLSSPLDLEANVRKFPVSTRLFVAGPSGSGKSTFVFKLISDPDKYFETPPRRIIYYYKTRPHRDFENLLLKGNVEFRNTDPSELVNELEKESLNSPGHTLVCIDDGLNYTEKSSNSPIVSLFNRLSNHCSLSLIFCSQILFGGSTRNLRQIFLNCNAFALFGSSNDAHVAKTLSSRIFYDKPQFLPSALRQVKARSPFTPLIVLTRPQIPSDDLRVFSGILKGLSTLLVAFIVFCEN